jgi:RHS repeat-associated protein
MSDIGTLAATGSPNPFTLFQIADLVVTDLQKKETPEAYMGYALYDSDSVLYEKGKILLSSQAENKHENLKHGFQIEKGGFMEAFLVNETSQDVFFDNFRIQSTPSTTVQVTHYYPFGMEMPALGYQAGGMSKNRYLYNQGTGEVTFDTERIPELNIDLTQFRAYDPTLGRWWQVDPMASEMSSWTPYNYGFNNPIRFNDPLGDAPSAMMRIGNTNDNIGQDQSEEWFGKQQAMNSNGGGGGIQKYLPSSPPTGKEGQKQIGGKNNQGQSNDVQRQEIGGKENNLEISGGVTFGVQAGIKLSSAFSVDINLASTPLLIFNSSSRNLTLDYPGKQDEGITINQGGEIALGGFGMGANTRFIGLEGGHIPIESNVFTKAPVSFPIISHEINMKTYNSGYSWNKSNSTVYNFSISFILKFELNIKVPN